MRLLDYGRGMKVSVRFWHCSSILAFRVVLALFQFISFLRGFRIVLDYCVFARTPHYIGVLASCEVYALCLFMCFLGRFWMPHVKVFVEIKSTSYSASSVRQMLHMSKFLHHPSTQTRPSITLVSIKKKFPLKRYFSDTQGAWTLILPISIRLGRRTFHST